MKAEHEIRYGEGNQMRTFVYWPELNQARISWGSADMPIKRLNASYGVREVARIITTHERWVDAAPDVIRRRRDVWRARCIKEGLVEVEKFEEK